MAYILSECARFSELSDQLKVLFTNDCIEYTFEPTMKVRSISPEYPSDLEFVSYNDYVTYIEGNPSITAFLQEQGCDSYHDLLYLLFVMIKSDLAKNAKIIDCMGEWRNYVFKQRTKLFNSSLNTYTGCEDVSIKIIANNNVIYATGKEYLADIISLANVMLSSTSTNVIIQLHPNSRENFDNNVSFQQSLQLKHAKNCHGATLWERNRSLAVQFLIYALKFIESVDSKVNGVCNVNVLRFIPDRSVATEFISQILSLTLSCTGFHEVEKLYNSQKHSSPYIRIIYTLYSMIIKSKQPNNLINVVLNLISLVCHGIKLLAGETMTGNFNNQFIVYWRSFGIQQGYSNMTLQLDDSMDLTQPLHSQLLYNNYGVVGLSKLILNLLQPFIRCLILNYRLEVSNLQDYGGGNLDYFDNIFSPTKLLFCLKDQHNSANSINITPKNILKHSLLNNNLSLNIELGLLFGSYKWKDRLLSRIKVFLCNKEKRGVYHEINDMQHCWLMLRAEDYNIVGAYDKYDILHLMQSGHYIPAFDLPIHTYNLKYYKNSLPNLEFNNMILNGKYWKGERIAYSQVGLSGLISEVEWENNYSSNCEYNCMVKVTSAIKLLTHLLMYADALPTSHTTKQSIKGKLIDTILSIFLQYIWLRYHPTMYTLIYDVLTSTPALFLRAGIRIAGEKKFTVTDFLNRLNNLKKAGKTSELIDKYSEVFALLECEWDSDIKIQENIILKNESLHHAYGNRSLTILGMVFGNILSAISLTTVETEDAVIRLLRHNLPFITGHYCLSNGDADADKIDKGSPMEYPSILEKYVDHSFTVITNAVSALNNRSKKDANSWVDILNINLSTTHGLYEEMVDFHEHLFPHNKVDWIAEKFISTVIYKQAVDNWEDYLAVNDTITVKNDSVDVVKKLDLSIFDSRRYKGAINGSMVQEENSNFLLPLLWLYNDVFYHDIDTYSKLEVAYRAGSNILLTNSDMSSVDEEIIIPNTVFSTGIDIKCTLYKHIMDSSSQLIIVESLDALTNSGIPTLDILLFGESCLGFFEYISDGVGNISFDTIRGNIERSGCTFPLLISTYEPTINIEMCHNIISIACRGKRGSEYYCDEFFDYVLQQVIMFDNFTTNNPQRTKSGDFLLRTNERNLEYMTGVLSTTIENRMCMGLDDITKSSSKCPFWLTSLNLLSMMNHMASVDINKSLPIKNAGAIWLDTCDSIANALIMSHGLLRYIKESNAMSVYKQLDQMVFRFARNENIIATILNTSCMQYQDAGSGLSTDDPKVSNSYPMALLAWLYISQIIVYWKFEIDEFNIDDLKSYVDANTQVDECTRKDVHNWILKKTKTQYIINDKYAYFSVDLQMATDVLELGLTMAFIAYLKWVGEDHELTVEQLVASIRDSFLDILYDLFLLLCSNFSSDFCEKTEYFNNILSAGEKDAVFTYVVHSISHMCEVMSDYSDSFNNNIIGNNTDMAVYNTYYNKKHSDNVPHVFTTHNHSWLSVITLLDALAWIQRRCGAFYQLDLKSESSQTFTSLRCQTMGKSKIKNSPFTIKSELWKTQSNYTLEHKPQIVMRDLSVEILLSNISAWRPHDYLTLIKKNVTLDQDLAKFDSVEYRPYTITTKYVLENYRLGDTLQSQYLSDHQGDSKLPELMQQMESYTNDSNKNTQIQLTIYDQSITKWGDLDADLGGMLYYHRSTSLGYRNTSYSEYLHGKLRVSLKIPVECSEGADKLDNSRLRICKSQDSDNEQQLFKTSYTIMKAFLNSMGENTTDTYFNNFDAFNLATKIDSMFNFNLRVQYQLDGISGIFASVYECIAMLSYVTSNCGVSTESLDSLTVYDLYCLDLWDTLGWCYSHVLSFSNTINIYNITAYHDAQNFKNTTENIASVCETDIRILHDPNEVALIGLAINAKGLGFTSGKGSLGTLSSVYRWVSDDRAEDKFAFVHTLPGLRQTSDYHYYVRGIHSQTCLTNTVQAASTPENVEPPMTNEVLAVTAHNSSGVGLAVPEMFLQLISTNLYDNVTNSKFKQYIGFSDIVSLDDIFSNLFRYMLYCSVCWKDVYHALNISLDSEMSVFNNDRGTVLEGCLESNTTQVTVIYSEHQNNVTIYDVFSDDNGVEVTIDSEQAEDGGAVKKDVIKVSRCGEYNGLISEFLDSVPPWEYNARHTSTKLVTTLMARSREEEEISKIIAGNKFTQYIDSTSDILQQWLSIMFRLIPLSIDNGCIVCLNGLISNLGIQVSGDMDIWHNKKCLDQDSIELPNTTTLDSSPMSTYIGYNHALMLRTFGSLSYYSQYNHGDILFTATTHTSNILRVKPPYTLHPSQILSVRDLSFRDSMWRNRKVNASFRQYKYLVTNIGDDLRRYRILYEDGTLGLIYHFYDLISRGPNKDEVWKYLKCDLARSKLNIPRINRKASEGLDTTQEINLSSVISTDRGNINLKPMWERPNINCLLRYALAVKWPREIQSVNNSELSADATSQEESVMDDEVHTEFASILEIDHPTQEWKLDPNVDNVSLGTISSEDTNSVLSIPDSALSLSSTGTEDSHNDLTTSTTQIKGCRIIEESGVQQSKWQRAIAAPAIKDGLLRVFIGGYRDLYYINTSMVNYIRIDDKEKYSISNILNGSEPVNIVIIEQYKVYLQLAESNFGGCYWEMDALRLLCKNRIQNIKTSAQQYYFNINLADMNNLEESGLITDKIKAGIDRISDLTSILKPQRIIKRLFMNRADMDGFANMLLYISDCHLSQLYSTQKCKPDQSWYYAMSLVTLLSKLINHFILRYLSNYLDMLLDGTDDLREGFSNRLFYGVQHLVRDYPWLPTTANWPQNVPLTEQDIYEAGDTNPIISILRGVEMLIDNIYIILNITNPVLSFYVDKLELVCRLSGLQVLDCYKQHGLAYAKMVMIVCTCYAVNIIICNCMTNSEAKAGIMCGFINSLS